MDALKFLKNQVKRIEKEQEQGIKDKDWHYVAAMDIVFECCIQWIGELKDKKKKASK